jgi:hypothetical protein
VGSAEHPAALSPYLITSLLIPVSFNERYTNPMLTALLFRKHLEADETLIKAVHKHWLLGLKALFWPTLFFAISGWVLSVNHARGMIVVMSVWNLVILIWWLRNFFDYYLDAWLITDQGIIDIAWHGWFHRQSTRVLYSDLQGISYEIKGVLGTLLRYGSIAIEKVSTGQAITLEYVGSPKQIELIVLKNQEAYLHSKNMKDAKHVQELLSAIVARQIQLEDMPDSGDNE